MEGTPFPPELPFEVRSDHFAFARRFGRCELRTFEEMGMTNGMFLVPRPKFDVIGHQSKLSVRFEDAVNGFERCVLDDPPLVMAGLRPRVAEVEMDHATDPHGKTMGDDLSRVVVEDADVREGPASKSIGRVSEELSSPLYAEEVRVGLQLGLLDQERPLARADLELERSTRIVEKHSGIPRPMLDGWQVGTVDTVPSKVEGFPAIQSE